MSLRWRIMGSMVIVIILTVLINIGVGYYATQARLGEFVDEIGDDEARLLAQNLSREYTTAGGWAIGGPAADRGRDFSSRTSRRAGAVARTRGGAPRSLPITTRFESSSPTSMAAW